MALGNAYAISHKDEPLLPILNLILLFCWAAIIHLHFWYVLYIVFFYLFVSVDWRLGGRGTRARLNCRL